MSGSAVAQNYAEALFELAGKSNQVERYGQLLEATGAAIAESPVARAVLMNPKVTKAAKAELLGKALESYGAPRDFGRYLAAVVKRGRQGILAQISAAYADLLDVKLNRVRAKITVARPADAAMVQAIAETLSQNVGKQVLPTIVVDPELLGGAVIRIGDRVHDGSVRRKLVRLRRLLLG